MRERDFIHWIRQQGGFNPAVVPVGPGDDCAIMMCGQEKLVVTVDQVLDGVHFRLGEHGFVNAGRKAMSRNLSDVAAMAALPLGAVAAFALPAGATRKDAEEIYRGLRRSADVFHCPIVGGDLSVWDDKLAISVTVFARPAGIRPVLRSGAKAGDTICVTGSLGGAWRGKRHIEFLPRINEARILACRHELHAMIDMSDGLSVDLMHICEASGLGAEINEKSLPIHPDAKAHASERPPIEAALHDGEDYELLFTLAADQAQQLLKDQPLPVKVSAVGTITESKGLVLIKPDGAKVKLEPQAWEHRTRDDKPNGKPRDEKPAAEKPEKSEKSNDKPPDKPADKANDKPHDKPRPEK
jgi:thiamine-monophosphate kinase